MIRGVKSWLVPALFILGVAGWHGYDSGRVAVEAAGKAPASIQRTVRRLFDDRTTVSTRDRLNDLRNAAGRAEMSPHEQAECWRLISGFTKAQVKDYFAEMPTDLRDSRSVNSTISEMLFYRWGQIDPHAALAASQQAPFAEGYTMTVQVITAWIKQDPEAAIQQLQREESSRLQMISASLIAGYFIQQDSATALQTAASRFPAAVPAVLILLAREAGATKESINDFLAMDRSGISPETWNDGIGQLASRFAGHDPAAALEHIGELKLSADEAALFKMTLLLEMEGSPLVARLERQNSASDPYSQKQAQSTYERWSRREPEQAADWALEHQSTQILADTIATDALKALTRGPQENTDSYPLSTLRSNYAAWEQLSPESAREWLKTMPSDIRKNLTSPHSDSSN